MAHFADMAPCSLFGARPNLLAVGWLAADVPYARGAVASAFGVALAELLVNPWQPWLAMGAHPCPFCRLSGGPGAVRVGKFEARVGSANLFVPRGGEVLVAPSSVLHYIDAHEYRPPGAFEEAVLECPPMRSMAYFKALRAAGFRLPPPTADR